jgi:hypothetical protein
MRTVADADLTPHANTAVQTNSAKRITGSPL